MKKGIDVSTWQGTIDFSKCKNQIDFVIFRSGFRFTTDNKFRKNCANALENGISVLGLYHFSYALSTADAVKEAEYCVSEAILAGLPKSTVLFFDFEYDSVAYAKRKGIKMGAKEINNIAIAFCEAVKAAGYRTGIYLNLDYYKNVYTQETLKPYYIWLADYTGAPDYPCTIHQYSSTGKINGISGNVDMNYLMDDELFPYYVVGKTKTVLEVAQEVINGKWGNGAERKTKLCEAGYDYDEVQKNVNELLNTPSKKTFQTTSSTGIAPYFDSKYNHAYICTTGLYLRTAAGSNKTALCHMPEKTEVICYGFYNTVNGADWLYVMTEPFKNGVIYTGFCHSQYLNRL